MTSDSKSRDTGTKSPRTLWPWIVAGASYGILLRVLFGWIPESVSNFGVMSSGFMFGAPFVAGAITVYAARGESRSFWFVIFGPWLTVALMLLGCAIALLEGSICIALMAPLFFFFAAASVVS